MRMDVIVPRSLKYFGEWYVRRLLEETGNMIGSNRLVGRSVDNPRDQDLHGELHVGTNMSLYMGRHHFEQCGKFRRWSQYLRAQ
jgi:hypothetical protein